MELAMLRAQRQQAFGRNLWYRNGSNFAYLQKQHYKV